MRLVIIILFLFIACAHQPEPKKEEPKEEKKETEDKQTHIDPVYTNDVPGPEDPFDEPKKLKPLG